MTEALYRTLQHLIHRDNIPDNDYVYFGVGSNRINHAYEYQRLKASEWMAGGGRVNGILEQLARILNANEQFKMDDSFQSAFVHVRPLPPPPPRQGHGKRKMKPGHRHPETFKRIKTSGIAINNKDDLCAARAIVTAKAETDGPPPPPLEKV